MGHLAAVIKSVVAACCCTGIQARLKSGKRVHLRCG